MEKLSDTETVRLFTPLSVEMRDEFRAKCEREGVTMAQRIRDMIQADISPKGNGK